MLRGFETSNSFPHGLKSPQKTEGILTKPPSVVAVVVVVEWLGCCAFFFLSVGAENMSRYVAPVCMACFRYRWLLVTVTCESKGRMALYEALSVFQKCSEKSLVLQVLSSKTKIVHHLNSSFLQLCRQAQMWDNEQLFLLYGGADTKWQKQEFFFARKSNATAWASSLNPTPAGSDFLLCQENSASSPELRQMLNFQMYREH